MAQKRYYEFRSDDDTFTLANHLVSLLPAGRYHGFSFRPQAGWDLILGHDTDPLDQFQRMQQDGTLTPALGVLRTAQGITIEEDQDVVISVPEADADLPRIDTIFLEHQYQRIQGGEQAVYGFLEGIPAANPEAPTLLRPTQTKLGTLYIPAGATGLDSAGVSFIREPSPFFGGGVRLENALAELQTQVGERVRSTGGTYRGDLGFTNLTADKVVAKRFETQRRSNSGTLNPGESLSEVVAIDVFSAAFIQASMLGGFIEINQCALIVSTGSNAVAFVNAFGGVDYDDGTVTIRTPGGRSTNAFSRNNGRRAEIIFDNNSDDRDARFSWTVTQLGRVL